MRIDQLVIRNFGILRHLSLDVTGARLIYVTGKNAVGKSTLVADALPWIFTGVCRGTDEGGRGIADLVRLGAEKNTMVGAVQTDEGEIRRAFGDGPRSASGMKIFGKIGVSPEIVLACLMWERLIDMPAKDAGALILGALSPKVDRAKVESFIEKDLRGLIHPDQEFASIDDVRAYAKLVYDKRQEIGRAAKEIRIPSVAHFPEHIRGLTIDEAREKLENSRALLDDLEQTAAGLEKLVGSDEPEDLQRETVEQKLTDNEMALERARQQRASALRLLGKDKTDLSKRKKKLEMKREAFEALLQEKSDLTARKDSIQAQVNANDEQAAALEALKGKAACPTCTQALSPELLKAVINDLLTKSTNLLQEQKGVIDTIEKISLTTAKKERDDADADLRKAEKLVEEVEGYDKDMEACTKQIEACRVQVAGMKARPADETRAKKKEELAEVQARIKAGNTEVARIEAFIEAKDQAGSIEDSLKHAKSEYETWSRLYDALRPGGVVQSALLGSQLAAFTDTVNAAMKTLQYEMVMTAEPFEIRVRKLAWPTDWSVPVKRLSDSERLRLGVSLEIALAKQTGFGIVAVDCLDRLFAGEDRGYMTDLFMDAIESGLQIWAAGTGGAGVEEYQLPDVLTNAGWISLVLQDEAEMATAEAGP